VPDADAEEPQPDDPSGDVPPDVARRLLRALDRSPSTVVVLIDPDLKTRWLSHSAQWLTNTDPATRTGRESLERVHPDDVEHLLHAFEQLREANSAVPGVPVMEPLRYRVSVSGDDWVTREALVLNLLHDPVAEGLVLIVRPVGGELDGVGHVVDLLVSDAPLPDVLAACACLVPHYVGSAAVVALLDEGPVVGAPAASPAARLSTDDRWWNEAVADGKIRAPIDFAGFPDDLADQARSEGFRSVWVLPLVEESTRESTGCVVVWVAINVELNIGTDHSIRQTQRLASLVIGEQRRHLALRRQAVTDPLTGVANRSALRRRLDQAPGPLTVGFVDLDDFKPINDTYGHDTGDTVLQEVAQRLLASVREDDLVVRLGGDEFAVVFADGTPTDGIDQLGRRILDAVELPVVLDDGTSVEVKASIGLATGPANEVIHHADAALYEAKRRKRA
jgi:diguanylate cyclase (GGDEF)-like protein